MRKMIALLAVGFAALLAYAPPALSQGNTTGLVLATCGSPPNTFVAGNPGPFTLGTDGQMCVKGTFTGTITGATSNASSGVATSSINVPTVSYNYGFNGTTWDQLRVGAGTATFALRTTTASNDPVITALGSPFQAGGSIGNTSFGTTSVNAPRTARGATITAGGTSQTLMAANASRKGFTIQNPCSLTTQNIAAAESLFINFTSAATVNTSANVAEIAPCSSYSEGLNGGAVSQEAITVIGATTGHIVYAKEF